MLKKLFSSTELKLHKKPELEFSFIIYQKIDFFDILIDKQFQKSRIGSI